MIPRSALLAAFLGCSTIAGVAAQGTKSDEHPLTAPYAKIVPVSISLPAYPPEAARKGEEGRVTVEFEVLGDGSVGKARVLGTMPSGPPALESAALAAVAKWRFEPSAFASRRTVQYIEFRKDGAVNIGGVNLPREAYERPQIRNTPEGAVIELASPPATKDQ